jgi:hypothetical protein
LQLSYFLGLALSLFVLNGMGDDVDPLTLTIRILALNGYLALSIAAIMTPFLKEVTLFFKKSFTKIHHYFAAAGLLSSNHRFYSNISSRGFFAKFCVALPLLFLRRHNSSNPDLRGFWSRSSAQKNYGILAPLPHSHLHSAVHRDSSCKSSRYQFPELIYPNNIRRIVCSGAGSVCLKALAVLPNKNSSQKESPGVSSQQ